MVRILRETREKDPENGIMIVTEGLFAMDSETPDLNKIQEICS